MSTNLGTVLVGLGYDLSALEKGAPEAFRLINSQTLGMSAEMKRASREGAESFRLIDEALGIHISRPLTRLLTQEFPGFAKGLQSVLGAGVVGALGVAGIEFFDKIAKSIEHAQKAQEEFAAAMRKTGDVVGDMGAGHARTMKEIELELAEKQGAPGAKMQLIDFKIDTAAMEQAKKAIGEITDAMEKESKAATDAGKWTTQFWDAVGYVAENFFSKSSESEEQAAQKFQNFKHVLDEIMRGAAQDPLGGMRESLKRLNDELSTTGAEIARKMTAIQTANAISVRGRHPDSGVDEAALANEQKYFEMLKSEGIALEHILQEDEGRRKLAAAPDIGNELERQLRAMEGLQSVIGQGLGKLSPEQDPLKKLATEIQGFKMQAENAFREIGDSGANALDMRTATARLAEYESRLDVVMQKAKADAAVLDAQKWLPTTIAPSGSAPQFAAPTVAPTLAAGGTAAAQFSMFAGDMNVQLKAAAAAFQDLLAPADKFNLAQKELNLLLKEGLIDQAAYTAAMQKATEEEAKSTNQLEKLLEKTDSVSAGWQAFVLELEQGDAGKFTLDFLNKGLQGFEDETVKALTGAKTNWASFFESLNQMALKFVMNKVIAQLFEGFAKSNIGKSLGLDKVLGHGAGQASTVTAENANTTATTANTQAILALTESLSAPSASPGGGLSSLFGGIGAGGGDAAEALGNSGDGALSAGAAGGMWSFASGTDYAPGGMSWVGEQGPELVNLPTGSSVTPNSALRSGTIEIHNHIDAKGAEIGVEDKISRALTAAAPQIIMRAVVASSEIAKRTPH